MAILDIRKQKNEEITEIQFDDSTDRILKSSVLKVETYNGRRFNICSYDDLDNFIAACQKAKELWYKP